MFSLLLGLILIVNSTTGEIFTASEKKLMDTPAGYEEVILPGGFSDYEFQEALTNYKYINGKFLLNVAKINEEETAKLEADEKKAEEDLINQAIMNLAIDALEAEGKVLKYHKKK